MSHRIAKLPITPIYIIKRKKRSQTGYSHAGTNINLCWRGQCCRWVGESFLDCWTLEHSTRRSGAAESPHFTPKCLLEKFEWDFKYLFFFSWTSRLEIFKLNAGTYFNFCPNICFRYLGTCILHGSWPASTSGNFAVQVTWYQRDLCDATYICHATVHMG